MTSFNPFSPTTLAPHFPPAIERSLALIAGRRNFIGELSNNARLMLAELVRYVCANRPQASFRVSTATLSASLGISRRTIYRIKSELEDEGWITRNQVQSRRIGMQIADIDLTPKALINLELATDQKVPIHARVSKTSGVPDDLQFLLDLRLNKYAVFSLMKIAGAHGSRLSDIANALKTTLMSEVKNVYSYLLSVIKRSTCDWALRRTQAKNKQPTSPTKPTFSADDATKKANGLKVPIKNSAQIQPMIDAMNGKVFKKLGGSQRITYLDGFYSISNNIWSRIMDVTKAYELWASDQLVEITGAQ